MDDDEVIGRDLKRVLATLRMDDDLARTLERSPRDTHIPGRSVPPSGQAALAALATAGPPADARFVMEGPLGAGGMGVVSLAVQTSMGRHVAVKTLREDASDPATAVRVLREAWVTGMLEHPNVVPVHDVGLDAVGSPFIVMKRIEGSAWSALLAEPELVRGRFGAEDVMEWHLGVLETVCNAVAFAHSRGIIHRDLKPENVMIGAFGEVYVVDWGLALSLRPDPTGRLPGREEARLVAGTPCYMAPEMILADADAVAETTDVYLLGAILYELFAGAPPHGDGTLEVIVSRILLSNPAFPAGFPAEAARIAERAMARAPADRYPSATALRDALRAYLRHRGSRRLAWEAKQSLTELMERAAAASGEDDDLALYNLLGEVRFGFRAALEAWPENRAARQGLDRALVTMVEHELSRGEPAAATALLRDVSEVPPELFARVDAATQKRTAEEGRRRALEADLDPRTGTRTRTFLGAIFGLLWTVVPLAAWLAERAGEGPGHLSHGLMSVGFLAFGIGLYVWARDSLGRTRLNRQLSRTLGLHFVAQACLAFGAYRLGLSPHVSSTLHVLTWMITLMLLGVWVERWFFVPAAFDGLVFLISSEVPDALYPLMAVANLFFTAVLVGKWFPRQDLARIEERRQALRQQARRLLFLEARRPRPAPPEEDA